MQNEPTPVNEYSIDLLDWLLTSYNERESSCADSHCSRFVSRLDQQVITTISTQSVSLRRL